MICLARHVIKTVKNRQNRLLCCSNTERPAHLICKLSVFMLDVLVGLPLMQKHLLMS